MYNKSVEIRWSDLDPNFHLRHSVYYDWGAWCRMCILTDYGCTAALMQQLNIGPILFREECLFKREIHFEDKVTINVTVKKASPTYSRWSFQHEIIKNEEILCAVINVDGAWLDTTKRKLTVPPEDFTKSFDQFPKAADFEWVVKSKQ